MRIVSWNVEHFKGAANRVERVVDHLASLNPDVFAILEVKKANVLDLMENAFQGFDFALTQGAQSQEILVGWRRAAFDGAVFTQKREFKAFNPALRPGALLTLKHGNAYTNLLFLHMDSGTKASDFGNRFEMFTKIFKLKFKIDESAGSRPGRFAVLGDLNTMGFKYPRQRVADRLLTSDGEIASANELAERDGMRFLRKEEEHTFYNGRLLSDLDHVIVSDGLPVRQQGVRDGAPFHVLVRGWNELSGAARDFFIDEVSDHSALVIDIDAP
ncbi:MAG: endonuclease/exonuclease/phosphatase family protein [Alphaproteobacteria bacterium]|nr:endonuclease/exonuclease/phosphatase family protein [Alphaproteobacteria bacterium]